MNNVSPDSEPRVLTRDEYEQLEETVRELVQRVHVLTEIVL